MAAEQTPASPLFVWPSRRLCVASSCKGDTQKQMGASLAVLLRSEVQRKKDTQDGDSTDGRATGRAEPALMIRHEAIPW